MCVVARHIATRTAIVGLEGILSGNPTQCDEDLNNLDARNVRRARDFADSAKEETLELLRHTSSHIGHLVAGLTDEQLKLGGQVLARGMV